MAKYVVRRKVKERKIIMEEWFGQVRWCEEDLKEALRSQGYPVTKENIAKLYNICQSYWFTDCMIKAGWQFMYDQIDESNGFEKEEEDHD